VRDVDTLAAVVGPLSGALPRLGLDGYSLASAPGDPVPASLPGPPVPQRRRHPGLQSAASPRRARVARAVQGDCGREGILSLGTVPVCAAGGALWAAGGAGEALPAIARRMGVSYRAVSRRVSAVAWRQGEERRFRERLARMSDGQVKT
jgi:hypothetical protein